MKGAGIKLPAALHKAVLNALSERDDAADICTDKDGYYEPDTDLRDTENVPLKQSIDDYVEQEVIPHVPDAWINDSVRDTKDGEIGRVGYEINFNRYFYNYQPPRPLAEIERDLRQIEGEILELLREVAA
jgi:type I restriction enzyme M protein